MADFKKCALIWTVFYIGHVAMAADIGYMRRTILDRFSKVRNHNVDPVSKNAARTHIYDEFRRFGLETDYNNFTYRFGEHLGTFSNVVGVIKGTRFGSADDRVIGVGAHYDTVRNSTGVDDNGAGVAAMLETVRQLTIRRGVTRKNTIVFVSFDLEEYGLIGSEMFIQTWVNPWLVRNYGRNATSVVPHGVIILDTVMEYNTSQNSQILPKDDTIKTIFPDAYTSIKSDGYQGDFLTLIYRKPTPDAALAKAFRASWTASGREEFEIEELPIPYADTSALNSLPGGINNLFRSDHVNFWNDNIASIFITDSANFRGDMTACYHQMCDNVEVMLTEDNLRFLGKTADTIAKTVDDLSEPKYHDTSGIEAVSACWRLVTLTCLVLVTNTVH